jgi:hypothetical protein
VAATFTGAMALAAALTPTFATAAHASSLRSGSCTKYRETWLHIRDGAFPGTTSWCWGYRGGRSLSAPAVGFNQECGGNNYGFIIWSTIAGLPHKSIYFHQGTGFAWAGGKSYDYSEVVGVHISGWKGNDKC